MSLDVKKGHLKQSLNKQNRGLSTWNTFEVLIRDNNWRLTSLAEVHSEVSSTSAAWWGGKTPCENEINLWPRVNVCTKRKHRAQTTHSHTHTVNMFDWSGTITQSTGVKTNCEDRTDALWPSTAVPFDGREETEGRSRRQVVTQLVLHYCLLQQEENETSD